MLANSQPNYIDDYGSPGRYDSRLSFTPTVAGTYYIRVREFDSFDGGEQKDLPPGSYVFQPSMGMHSDACIGSEDCILFIHQHSKGSYIRKEQ